MGLLSFLARTEALLVVGLFFCFCVEGEQINKQTKHSLGDTLGVHDVGLEAEHGEYHQRGQHGGEEVDEGDQHGVQVAVVVALVVAGEGDDAAKAKAQGEEHLRGRLPPHLGLQHDLQLGEGRHVSK